MKKLYTLIATAAVAVGATAAPTLVNNLPVQAHSFNAEFVQAINTTEYAPAKAAATLPTGDWNAIGQGQAAEGLLEDINEEIEGADQGLTWAVTIEQSVEDEYWFRTIVYNENSPMMDVTGEPDTDYFYFNISNPDKVYSTKFLIGGGEYEVYQQVEESGLFDMLKDPSALRADPKYGKLTNGVITFPAGAFWVLDNANSRFLRVDNLGGFAIALPGAEIPALWNDLGTATWTDGVFGPLYTDPSVAITSDIMVQSFRDNDMIFRLVQPWYEVTESAKNLVVDVTYINPADKKRVGVVEQQSTGVTLEKGLAYVFSRSINYAKGLEDFIKDPESYPKYNITYDEATRRLSLPINSLFFYYPSSDPEHVYSWKEEYQAESFVIVPEAAGIENTVVDNDANAPREYYNLQGIRVANPENGLYIVRQGNKVSKTYIR